MPRYGGVGVNSSLTPVGTNKVTLPSGGVFMLPSGPLIVQPGPNAALQQLDPITGLWWTCGGGEWGMAIVQYIWCDGTNYRLANQTGCTVGASITNVGSGYTSAPTLTAGAGSPTFKCIVGGAVSQTVTVVNGGSNYTYPPIVIFSAPPPGAGVQATGYCTLSGGAVSTVTMDNQGAGYLTPPTISFINDPRETYTWNTQGYGASAVCTLTGSGTVTAVLCLDHGQGGQTSVPTLTPSGGGGSSFAATAIMNFSVTAYTVTTAGTGFTAPIIVGIDNFPTAETTVLQPQIHLGLVRTRSCWIKGAVSSGALTATGQVVYDGGCFTGVPTLGVIESGTLITATGLVAATVGGVNSTSYFMAQ
jgi:hypothetical protein